MWTGALLCPHTLAHASTRHNAHRLSLTLTHAQTLSLSCERRHNATKIELDQPEEVATLHFADRIAPQKASLTLKFTGTCVCVCVRVGGARGQGAGRGGGGGGGGI